MPPGCAAAALERYDCFLELARVNITKPFMSYDLRQLAEAGIVEKVLASGEKAGYHYELHGCNTIATAAAFSLSLSALPMAQGKTGKFAFCANQEGMLWYASSGSADECFSAGKMD
jgi:hypothetical protein